MNLSKFALQVFLFSQVYSTNASTQRPLRRKYEPTFFQNDHSVDEGNIPQNEVAENMIITGKEEKVNQRIQNEFWSDKSSFVYGSEYDNFGLYVSSSYDGKIMAITGKTQIKIYRLRSERSNEWDEIEIKGLTDVKDRNSGFLSVALSAEGKIVAIGNSYDDKAGTNSGEVVLYGIQSDESWKQLGSNMIGQEGDYFGRSVALSSDGYTLIVGAAGGEYVEVLKYQESAESWVEYLHLSYPRTMYKHISVSMSGDGNYAIIGAPYYINDSSNGLVRIIDINNVDQSQYFFGGSSYIEDFGFSVSMSLDGRRACAGARNYVQAFYLDNDKWFQLGDKIHGPTLSSRKLTSISMNENGEFVAIGSPSEFKYVTHSGSVYLFKYEAGSWREKYETIHGEGLDKCGTDVSLSGDGTRLAVGCPAGNWHSQNNNPGKVGIYSIPGYNTEVPSYYETSVPTLSPVPDDTKSPSSSNPYSWNITMVEVDDGTNDEGKPTIEVRYESSDRDYRIEVFQDDCQTSTDVFSKQDERTDSDKDGFMFVDVDLTIDQNKLENSPLWNADGSVFSFCMAKSLLTPDADATMVTQKKIIFRVSVDNQASFEIDGIATEDETEEEHDIDIVYKATVEAFQCDENSYDDVDGTVLGPFDTLNVCVEVDVTEDPGVIVDGILDLTVTQEVTGITFLALENGETDENVRDLVSTKCNTEGVCMVRVQLINAFFSNPQPLKVDGVATLGTNGQILNLPVKTSPSLRGGTNVEANRNGDKKFAMPQVGLSQPCRDGKGPGILRKIIN